MRAIERRLQEAAQSSADRIVVGPWSGNIQAEVLEWIPFVRWAVETHDLKPDRLVALSHDDVGTWYDDVASTYVDLAASPESRAELGGNTAPLLQPGDPQALFDLYWTEQVPVKTILRYLRFARLSPPGKPPVGRYVVVSLTPSACMPESEQNRQLVGRLVSNLSSHTRVIDLSEADHASKAECSTLVAAADAVVGSFGCESVSLGIAHGVRTIALYSAPAAIDSRLATLHLYASRGIGGPYAIVNAAALELVTQLRRGAYGGLTAVQTDVPPG